MEDSMSRPRVPVPGNVPDDDTGDMPEHERPDDQTVGGGVLEQGGTAIDRGTGTLGGQAQGPAADDDRDDALDPEGVEKDEVQPNPQMHG
jgi:hypothetical protein